MAKKDRQSDQITDKSDKKPHYKIKNVVVDLNQCIDIQHPSQILFSQTSVDKIKLIVAVPCDCGEPNAKHL